MGSCAALRQSQQQLLGQLQSINAALAPLESDNGSIVTSLAAVVIDDVNLGLGGPARVPATSLSIMARIADLQNALIGLNDQNQIAAINAVISQYNAIIGLIEQYDSLNEQYEVTNSQLGQVLKDLQTCTPP